MFRKLLSVLAGLLLLFPATVLAQDTGTVAGTVIDSTTSQTLPGVNVTVQGLNIGAATGPDGQFEISDVPAGEQVLQASFVGYTRKSITVDVEAGETTSLDVRLAPEAVGLDDVVVTALGQEREERAITTSVQQVSGEEVSTVSNENFVNALKGKVAGANIRSSNYMGGSSNIVLRGYSSLSGDNQPLIVVDGIVINNRRGNDSGQAEGDGGFDYGNAASSIDPNAVESISVLKGPSAAALYGSRAADGVIQITTKSGERNQDEIGVTFSTEVNATQAYEFVDYQNEYGGGSSTAFRTLDGKDYHKSETDQYYVQYSIDESFGPRLDGRPTRQWYSWDDVNGLEGEATPWEAHPDAVRDFLQTGLTYENNLALSDGGESYNFRVSLNSRNTTRGVSPNSEMDRYQVRFNGSFDLSDDLTATTVARYSDRSAEGRAGTGYEFANNPMAPFNTFTQRQLDYGPDSYMRDYARPNGQQRGWNYSSIEGTQGVTSFEFTDNPYTTQFENYQSDSRKRIFGKAQINYDFVESLSGQYQVTIDQFTERRKNRRADISSENPSAFEEDVLTTQELNTEARFSYSEQLTERFDLEAFAAGRVRYESFDRNTNETRNGLATPGVFSIENSIGRPNITDFTEEKLVYSAYGSVNVGYNDFAYLEGTLRNDWSSTLPEDNNSYLYPSISGNLVFTGFDALQDQSILSFGKIRASWAQVGNDTSPYQTRPSYSIGTPFDGQPLLNLPRESPNQNLKPEITTSVEVGANLKFFQNRISLNTTYYRDVTRDQILNINVSSASGFNRALVNAGEILNRGLEASLTVTPLRSESTVWNVTANFNRNVNTVEELAEGIDTYEIENAPPRIVAEVGGAYGDLQGEVFRRDANGRKVFDRSGNPVTTNEPKSLGSFQPDWTGGLSTSFSYEDFSARAVLDGQVGGKIWSLSNGFGQYSGLVESTVSGNQRETFVIPDGVVLPEGTDPSNASEVEGIPYGEAQTDAPLLSPSTHYKNNYIYANHTYDATHLRLQEVAFSYSLPVQEWLGSTPLQQATVSVTGSNLLLLYKEAPNIDPGATLNVGNIQGVEFSQLPSQRTYGFRLNLQF